MIIAVNFPISAIGKKPGKIEASTGFIAQFMVEHLTGIAEVTDSNPVEEPIVSGFFSIFKLRIVCAISF